MRSLTNAIYGTSTSLISGLRVRALHTARPCPAQVSPPLAFSWSRLALDDQARGSASSQSSVASSSVAQHQRASIQDKRERKLREYEAKIKLKAMQEGLSPQELKRRSLEFAAVKPTQPFGSKSIKATPSNTLKTESKVLSQVEKRDQAIAQSIQDRANAEAAKKLASGQVHSTPTGSQEGPIKPLDKFLDVEKLKTQDQETITQLWARYHTLKNKLSAVIPTEKYLEMLANARKYPQFVLPLPRQVIDEESDVAGTSKQAFEMQFLEWAVIPNPSAAGAPPSATTLFTPLAEYKLKQDFSQPVLILTFYTDLSSSNGIVLMRGEVTGLNEKTGKGGRIDQAQAQLLALTLQRFYLPSSPSAAADQETKDDASACTQLLHDFHKRPEHFDVEHLVNVAFRLFR